MEKYGFVYIWYDQKYKRYYIGCRWGREDDSYICSSTWMKLGYKKRPNDFNRRILTRVYTNKKDLLEEEYKWLKQIKKEELGKRYYNLHNHHFGHWSATENAKSVLQKQSERMKGNRIHLGHIHSEETKAKIGALQKGQKRGPLSEATKQKISQKQKGKPRPYALGNTNGRFTKGRVVSEETRRKLSEAAKQQWSRNQ